MIPQQVGCDAALALVENFTPALQLLGHLGGLDIVHGLLDRMGNLGIGCRLNNIVESPVVDGFLGIVEFGVGREEDTAGFHPLFPHPFKEVQPVFHRHFDITEHDIRSLTL